MYLEKIRTLKFLFSKCVKSRTKSTHFGKKLKVRYEDRSTYFVIETFNALLKKVCINHKFYDLIFDKSVVN